MIIGITGVATAGKDSVADAIVELFTNFVKRGWADALRRDMWILNPIVAVEETFDYVDGVPRKSQPVTYQQAVERYGYNEAKAKYPEVRRLLQVYGTDVHRSANENFWIDRTFDTFEPFVNYVLADTRFPNEAAACDKLILVTRPGVVAVNGHVSDAGLVFDLADVTIVNDGDLDDLRKKVWPLITGWLD